MGFTERISASLVGAEPSMAVAACAGTDGESVVGLVLEVEWGYSRRRKAKREMREWKRGRMDEQVQRVGTDHEGGCEQEESVLEMHL